MCIKRKLVQQTMMGDYYPVYNVATAAAYPPLFHYDCSGEFSIKWGIQKKNRNQVPDLTSDTPAADIQAPDLTLNIPDEILECILEFTINPHGRCTRTAKLPLQLLSIYARVCKRWKEVCYLMRIWRIEYMALKSAIVKQDMQLIRTRFTYLYNAKACVMWIKNQHTPTQLEDTLSRIHSQGQYTNRQEFIRAIYWIFRLYKYDSAYLSLICKNVDAFDDTEKMDIMSALCLDSLVYIRKFVGESMSIKC